MSNDKQTDYLDKLPNSFELVNRVRCFNHTMQLLAKALMKPFDTPIAMADLDNAEATDVDDMLSVTGDNDDEEGEGDGDGDIDFGSVSSNDDQDDLDEIIYNNDPFEELDSDTQQKLLEDKAAICTVLDKVCSCSSWHIKFL